MCGIIGAVALKGRVAKTLPISSLAHRGPDGQGEWLNAAGNVILGHTRLAILDPSPAGRQPMQEATGRFTITFNGEIYNHLELRALVQDVTWRGTSDTETLVELYARMGMKVLPLLRGMFAFALHDAADDSVLLVRDRLGIKPLWYCINKEGLFFSSEVRPLLEQAGEKQLLRRALSEYLGFGRMPSDGEIITSLSGLPAGSWLRYHAQGQMEQGTWWPQAQPGLTRKKGRKDAVRHVRELITEAVQEHLISDVGIGAFLSGGIDSSILTLIAGALLGKNLQTFTVGFPQREFDEREIARLVAKKAGSDHTELEVSEEICLEWVKEAVDCLDLPSVDAINTYIVSRAVRQAGLKVALSGLGGDELFGGYPSFAEVPILARLNVLPKFLKHRLPIIMPGRMKEKLEGLSELTTQELTIARRRFTSRKWLHNAGLHHPGPEIPTVPGWMDAMATISWSEMQAYMIPMLLRDSDQMSMAVGLEIRVPYLDHRVVEEVLLLPGKFKRGAGVKQLLVDAFVDDLPEEVYKRPKQGFALPMRDWIQGPLENFTQDGLQKAAEILSINTPQELKSAFSSGKLHWTRIWKWSVLGHWLDRQSVHFPTAHQRNVEIDTLEFGVK